MQTNPHLGLRVLGVGENSIGDGGCEALQPRARSQR